MHFRLMLLAAVLAVLLLTAPATASAQTFLPGEVLVRYEPGASSGERARTQTRTGTGRSDKLPGGTRRLRILDGETVAETLRELRAHGGVASAVPNFTAHASAFVPNDPGFQALQWNLVGPASVNAPEAWEAARAAGAPGGRGATVAVLDSGVAYRSRGRFRRAPDLYANRFLRGYDFVDEDRYPDDENGHGTHVTGTIAQRTNNGSGVAGLAYGVRIMPLRVLDKRGVGDAAGIARAIRYAARRRVDVINISLEFAGELRAAQVPEVLSAVRYARRRGSVIVGAAGNEGRVGVAFPARTPQVISVGATTRNRCAALYSNTGPGLDLTAPGGGDDGPYADNPRDAENCRPGLPGDFIYQETFLRQRLIGRFGLPPRYQGTSMSAPHVSAVAAMVIATGRLGKDPSPAAVEEHLERTATDLGAAGPDERYGAGLLNAAAALAR